MTMTNSHSHAEQKPQSLEIGSIAYFRVLILHVINECYEPSFAELACIPGFSGDVFFGSPQSNVCLWPTVSEPAAYALMQLLIEKKIQVMRAHPAVYAEADEMLELPIVSSFAKQATMSWLPSKFRANAFKIAPRKASKALSSYS